MRVWLLALTACGRIDFGEIAEIQDAGAMVVGGNLTLDSGTLLASAPAGTGNRAFLVKVLRAATASIHVEADIAFDAGMDGEMDLVQIHWHDLPSFCQAAGSFGYYLVRDRTGVVEIQETYVNCGATTSSNDRINSFPPSGPGSTHHVAIDVTLGAVNAAHVRATVDGTIDVDKAITAYDVPAGALDLRLGIPGESMATAAWAVHYDNLIVDVL